MEKVRKFLAIPVWGPDGGCYHDGFQEVFDNQEKEAMSLTDVENSEGFDLGDKDATLQALGLGMKVKQLQGSSGDKYRKVIYSVDGKSSIIIDIYSVIECFAVTNPGCQHAIKKILMAGQRGKVETPQQDLEEAVVALQRAVQIEELRAK